MQDYHFFQWLMSATLGLTILSPIAASALGIVQYTPSNTFTLNVTIGNSQEDFGTVHIQSDSPNGWILQVRSTQGGALRHSIYSYTIPYSLTVDGELISNLSSGNDITVRTTSTLTCDAPVGCTFPVQATLIASEVNGKPAGPYLDTLVFTLINQ
ncbi:hypothetical protein [Leptolyngbya sp. PCC 6406]|uniref:hypothetical protein n=1 Tax=Leptolyngbya sp. PCC 6406 TaxID=1173264 RepID=UPI0002AC6B2E|nr:hypothetical protein [Leptolyngbya sp. PCC 6406]